MKKLKKIAAGFMFAGTAAFLSPVIAFAPAAQSVVFAEDDAIQTVEGESFEISAEIPSAVHNVRFVEEGFDYQILSDDANPSEDGASFTANIMVVINNPGKYTLVIEDESGATAKSISVNVTPAETDPADDGGTTEEAQNTEQGTEGSGETGSEGTDVISEGGEAANQTEENGSVQNEPEYIAFLPISNGKISGTTESGEFKPGERITLTLEPNKGYVLSNWRIMSLDGRNVTKDLNIENNSFVLPDYPIRISAELNYNLVHEIELLDVTETLKPGALTFDDKGKPTIFTGHVKDNTDSRFFLLAEVWVNEYDTKGIASYKSTNDALKANGLTVLDAIDAGDKYNYTVMFMTTEGYEFAEDVKLLYNGKEYKPADVENVDGKMTVAFAGFLSSGEQTNPRETKKTTKTVTREETRKETVTQYVTNTYTYTTYQYVTRVVPAQSVAAAGTVRKSVAAAATGDTNNTAVWIALAIAAGGGVVSGILVGRRRKRNR